jgi:hypothetical protein
MTKKDYILIAAALKAALQIDGKDEYLPAYKVAIRRVADTLCADLARDNPRFDRERFLRAAGVQS